MTQTPRPSRRLFVDAELSGDSLALDAEQAHYLGRVLRCREGERLVVFNARGGERIATITSLARRRPAIALGASVEPLPEPSLRIVLLQALVKSDAMDLIVQKATEIGVAGLIAVQTDFSVVRLDAARRASRLSHWRRVALSACEQSGRHRPPDIAIHDSLEAAVDGLPPDAERIAFVLTAGAPVPAGAGRGATVCLAIGPEGGFSPGEAEYFGRRDFALHSLGPRTLRAETAAIAACAGLQFLNGDLG